MTRADYLRKAEEQEKLAVWARRARKPVKAAKHDESAAYWRAEAERAVA